VIKKYLDHCLLVDFILCILLGATAFLFRDQLKEVFTVPKDEVISKFMDSVIKLGATVIGFLLTIISVIITFRSTFLNQKMPDNSPKSKDKKDSGSNEPVMKTVFDKVITKKEQFYTTDIHKQVMKVFLNSVYEMGVIVFLFLFIQSELLFISHFWKVLFVIMGLTFTSTAVLRSIFIYRLFINVHVENK
jgi:hypothetical protein